MLHLMDELAPFCCLNADCPDYGKRGQGNLTVCGHYGKNHHRLLYCKACKARFSEFEGTPFFNAKLPYDKVLGVLEHLDDGCGTRQTARLVGVCKDTVTRLALLAGQHAKDTHDEVVAFSPGDARGPVRREVGVRGPEAEELQRQRPRR